MSRHRVLQGLIIYPRQGTVRCLARSYLPRRRWSTMASPSASLLLSPRYTISCNCPTCSIEAVEAKNGLQAVLSSTCAQGNLMVCLGARLKGGTSSSVKQG